MNLKECIKRDYVNFVNFAKKEGLNYKCLLNVLSGRTDYTYINNKLIELGYIKSANDLKKEA